jgi:hypothetical protein
LTVAQGPRPKAKVSNNSLLVYHLTIVC